jgi:hypothetical protein
MMLSSIQKKSHIVIISSTQVNFYGRLVKVAESKNKTGWHLTATTPSISLASELILVGKKPALTF